MMELICDQSAKQHDQENEFPNVYVVVAGDDEPVEEELESEDDVKVGDYDILGFNFFEGDWAHMNWLGIYLRLAD
jgi:hypothetical protein